MKVATKRFGPTDHGRRVTDAEAYAARYKPGYKYEIIDGRLYVSPQPNWPENQLDDWLYGKVSAYKNRRPEIINRVSGKARVFVPGRDITTCPEPDLAAYHDAPIHLPFRDVAWEDVSPVLVAEILSDADPFKDLVRNVQLYLEVPSIREYWIVDGSDNPDAPSLIVYRRRGDRWLKKREFAYGATYATPLLPGFRLIIDPRR
jgi:Uma2 family endonuclease